MDFRQLGSGLLDKNGGILINFSKKIVPLRLLNFESKIVLIIYK